VQVIDAAEPARLQAALQEQQLTEQLAAAAAQHPESAGYAHWTRMLESWRAHATSSDMGRPWACVVLALAPLHQTAAQVLAYRGVSKRRGLPLHAVRGLALQALLALDALHR
jgi:hypothetical protein